MTIRTFPWALTVAVGVCLAILISLGVWQLQRLEWKEELLARRAALADSAPVALSEALARTDDLQSIDTMRVVVTCPGLATAPYETLYGLSGRQVVSRLISACVLTGGDYDAVLVDRGAVGDDTAWRPEVDAVNDAAMDVVGILSTVDENSPPPGADGLWMRRDLSGMAAALGVTSPAPVFLIAETSTNPEAAALEPGLPPNELSNNHLQYALTWFGLALVLCAIYAAMLAKRIKTS